MVNVRQVLPGISKSAVSNNSAWLYLFFILEKNGPKESLDKYASLLDIAPILLSVLGVDAEDYNLGVNLLGDDKTMKERIEDPDLASQRWLGKLGELFY